MAEVDGKDFATSLGINFLICIFVFMLFGFLRKASFAQKFYAPKRHTKGEKRPKRLPVKFWAWIRPVYSYTQQDIVELAGIDAAMFMRILSFGAELFFTLSLYCCIVILPVNLAGGGIGALDASNSLKSSNFTYWQSPPSPPAPPSPRTFVDSPPLRQDSQDVTVHKAPDFYQDTPPAPPGLVWWHYKSDTPPLPDPAQYFEGTPLASAQNWSEWGWAYDQDFQTTAYSYTTLDKTTWINIQKKDRRTWIHVLSTWVITFIVLRLLWRFNKEAIHLRVQHHITAEKGREAHTVFVQDIPGIPSGTFVNRIETRALKFLPGFVRKRLKTTVSASLNIAAQGYSGTVGVIGRGIIPEMGSRADIVVAEPAAPAEAPEQHFYDAHATTLPVCGVRETEAKFLDGPEEDIPREEVIVVCPRTSKPEESLVEMDAWTRPAALLASGYNMEQIVKAEFEDIFPGEVATVSAVRETGALDRLVSEYRGRMQSLTDLLEHYTRQRRRHTRKIVRRKVTVVGWQFGGWGLETYGPNPKAVDAIDFYTARLQQLWLMITEQQQVALTQFAPAAFVTFHTRRAQAMAANVHMHHDSRRYWRTCNAPQPRDVIWPNLGLRAWERNVRSILIWAIFIVLTIFYIVPISAIQVYIQVNRLSRVAALKWLVTWPVLSGFFVAFLPTLVLRLFLWPVPYLLSIMSRFQGLVSQSKVDTAVIRKYFIFQVVTVFIATVISGSLADELEELIHNPSQIITVLANGAPSQAVFFMSYLLLLALTVKPISLLRIPALVVFRLRTAVAYNERSRARLWQNQHMDYGNEVPDHTIAILLGLEFCIMEPLITVVALLYFLATLIVYKYQMLYVFAPKYQNGGKMWRQVAEQVLAALFLFQLTMAGLMGSKGVLAQTILIVPLLFITVGAWLISHSVLTQPARVISLRAATDLDRHDQAETPTRAAHAEASQKMYTSPSFKLDRSAMDALLMEAVAMSNFLESHGSVMESGRDDLILPVARTSSGTTDLQSGSETSLLSAKQGPQPKVQDLASFQTVEINIGTQRLRQRWSIDNRDSLQEPMPAKGYSRPRATPFCICELQQKGGRINRARSRPSITIVPGRLRKHLADSLKLGGFQQQEFSKMLGF
ncbi:hypothetical protein WJX84_002371 [Apatococcus fuscideae]|uniref:Uncharacterized protein n=1 Tax=Apatococcus fuscideae TaxID=2026836 RepID=A0AAW1SXF7_9CHLO